MDVVPRRPLSGGAAKVFKQVMRGRSDTNVPFKKLRRLLLNLGFQERIGGGSHHKFCIAGLGRPINLQPVEGGKCKPYEVRQVREVLEDTFLADTELYAT